MTNYRTFGAFHTTTLARLQRTSKLGPCPDPEHSVHPPLAWKLARRLGLLERRFGDLLIDDGPEAWASIEFAVYNAHKALRFGRPMLLPSARSLFDLLLLSPGPDALVAVWRLGGEASVLTLASERAASAPRAVARAPATRSSRATS